MFVTLAILLLNAFAPVAIRPATATNNGWPPPAPATTELNNWCNAPIDGGTAPPDAPYWMETIPRRGISAFNPDPTYKVFRNVRDFGAVGDGVHDDTEAINRAISEGNRCGPDCGSSTLTPALIYFPRGTYLVSKPLISYYYTQMVGDARQPPTLLASDDFEGIAVIDVNPYLPDGQQWYINQVIFFRSVRNFVIDVRRTQAGTGIHWQVSQATSLTNVRVEMSTDPTTEQQGLFMENGSGGYMGDLTFRGGKIGMAIGNQQFTVRNLKIEGARTGISAVWNWGWTFQGLEIRNCEVGFDMKNEGIGSEIIIDGDIYDTGTFILTSPSDAAKPSTSILLDNVRLTNVDTAVADTNGRVVLPGGTRTIASWAQGNVYTGTSPTANYVQGDLVAPPKAPSLLDQNGRMFGRTRPQYEDFSPDQFISVKDFGAKGDGIADDTEAIRHVINKFHKCKIIYFDAGTYIVTDTIFIPPGTRIVGELWSVIMGAGPNFQDINNPRVVIKVGEEQSKGIVEITDIVFSTRGPAAGAIVVEWNIHDPDGKQGAAGTWDTHIRLGSTQGTELGSPECRKQTETGDHCFAAFLALHLTQCSSAYLEGMWIWNGDHDLDNDQAQVTVYSGRGLLSESKGPVWLIGTGSEHHVMYQYNLHGAKDHYLGLIQTETPYFQPVPPATEPFQSVKQYHDPDLTDMTSSWGLWVKESCDILIYGAGLYSFFDNYAQDCIATTTCQSQIAQVDDWDSVFLYSLTTVGTTYQLSRNQQGVINQADNRKGFASTATAWSNRNLVQPQRRRNISRRWLPRGSL